MSNSLLFMQCQAIALNNYDLLSIETLGTHPGEMSINIQTFSLNIVSGM